MKFEFNIEDDAKVKSELEALGLVDGRIPLKNMDKAKRVINDASNALTKEIVDYIRKGLPYKLGYPKHLTSGDDHWSQFEIHSNNGRVFHLMVSYSGNGCIIKGKGKVNTLEEIKKIVDEAKRLDSDTVLELFSETAKPYVKKIIEELEKLGYKIDYKIVDTEGLCLSKGRKSFWIESDTSKNSVNDFLISFDGHFVRGYEDSLKFIKEKA